MKIKTLIIIPARSGSKGITNKNIKKLGDYPLLAWTAKAVEQSNIDQALVIISTNSKKYAKIAQQYGLKSPFIRPKNLSHDLTSAYETARHAIDWFRDQYNYQPEQIMWLQPTSPFRSPQIINQAIKLMAKKNINAIIGCKSIERDLSTLFKYDTSAHSNGYLEPLTNKQQCQTRRQDIAPILTPNGAMYLIKSKVLLKQHTFFPSKSLPLKMNTIMSHDIDNNNDWLIAQAYIQSKLDWLN